MKNLLYTVTAPFVFAIHCIAIFTPLKLPRFERWYGNFKMGWRIAYFKKRLREKFPEASKSELHSMTLELILANIKLDGEKRLQP
jgi:hypothetical protein